MASFWVSLTCFLNRPYGQKWDASAHDDDCFPALAYSRGLAPSGGSRRVSLMMRRLDRFLTGAHPARVPAAGPTPPDNTCRPALTPPSSRAFPVVQPRGVGLFCRVAGAGRGSSHGSAAARPAARRRQQPRRPAEEQEFLLRRPAAPPARGPVPAGGALRLVAAAGGGPVEHPARPGRRSAASGHVVGEGVWKRRLAGRTDGAAERFRRRCRLSGRGEPREIGRETREDTRCGDRTSACGDRTRDRTRERGSSEETRRWRQPGR